MRSELKTFLEQIKRKDNYIVTENEVDEMIKLVNEYLKERSDERIYS